MTITRKGGISKCVRKLIKRGYSRKRAVAASLRIKRQRGKKRRKKK